MGGVLLSLDMDRCVRQFKEKAGFADIEQFLDKFHQKGFIGEMEAGTIDEDEFYVRCLKHCAPGTTPEVVRQCFESLLDGLNMEVVGCMAELSKKYPLYLLTNNNPISRRAFDTLMQQIGLNSAELFTKQFYSFEMKMLKPSREIYLKAVQEIGLEPSEILFIDDSPTNCRAAEEVGIKTLQYVAGMDIMKFI